MIGIPKRRKAIPLAVRLAVIERDGMVCQICTIVVHNGRSHKKGMGKRTRLNLDHIIPHSQGGPDTVENLRVTCAACNWARPRV